MDDRTEATRQLDLPFTWSPAADNQFGTLLLSRLPIRSAESIRLPVAGRAQGRSVLRAMLYARGGQPVTVLATHLQHRNDPAAIAARAHEIEVVLDRWGGAPRTLVIGDLNPRMGDPPLPARHPGELPEIRAFLDAGFATTQRLTDCSEPTSGRTCSDFVFSTRDLRRAPTTVLGDDTFDHRPVSTMVTVG